MNGSRPWIARRPAGPLARLFFRAPIFHSEKLECLNRALFLLNGICRFFFLVSNIRATVRSSPSPFRPPHGPAVERVPPAKGLFADRGGNFPPRNPLKSPKTEK